MKIRAFVILISVCLAMASCMTIKDFEKRFDKEALVGREPGSEAFIIKNNGERISGHKITYSHYKTVKAIVRDSWIAVDGVKVNDNDCAVVQSDKDYSARYVINKNKDRMLTRLRYGKINLYYYVEQDRVTDVNKAPNEYHAFAFEKEKGNFHLLNFEGFSDALKDDPAAQQKLKELFPKGKIPKYKEKGNIKNLIEVTELYNKS